MKNDHLGHYRIDTRYTVPFSSPFTSVPFLPPGFLSATVSTGSSVQRIVKLLGSNKPAITEPITAELELSGRSGVLYQLNEQRHRINGSHTAQLTATGVLILNSTSGEVVQTISPLICSPRQFAEADGIDTGPTSEPIILLVLCQTRRVLAMVEVEEQFVIRAYITRNIQSNQVAVTMSTSGGSPATGLAFLNNDILFHFPYLSGSPFPVIFGVSSSLNCQQPALSSLNTTHYLLVCQDKFYTVDKDAITTLIGSRGQGSKISSSENGEVVVLLTGTHAEVRTNYLTQSCSLDVAGLLTVDFTKVENSILVLFFTSEGVYLHNVSTGCPSSTPSLLTMTPVAPVCLEQQACFGYYFTEDINLLFVTSQKSTNPDRYEVEAYDMTSNTSLDLNFVLNEPPLLLHYEPLPPLLPTPTPSSSDTLTSTPVTSSSPVATPPSPNIETSTQTIIIIAGVFGLMLLGCVAIAGVITGLVIYKCLHHKRHRRELSPAQKCLSSESLGSSESGDSINIPQIHTPIQATVDTPVREEYETSCRVEQGPPQPEKLV